MNALYWISNLGAPAPTHYGLKRSYVLGGPLRGIRLSMHDLEQPAYVLGTYERHVARVIKQYVRPDSVAYDCGAHIGYISLLLARAVRATGSVYAFEPNPQNCHALEANIQENELHNVVVIPAAVDYVSGSVTFATFSYSLVGHIASPQTPTDAVLITVPSVSIDDFVYREGHPAPQFIKIDVEGAEARILYGSKRILKEVRPVIVAEVRTGVISNEITNLMHSLGYISRLLGGNAGDRKDLLADVMFVPQEMVD
jgi:FkbM family methyltransferase